MSRTLGLTTGEKGRGKQRGCSVCDRPGSPCSARGFDARLRGLDAPLPGPVLCNFKATLDSHKGEQSLRRWDAAIIDRRSKRFDIHMLILLIIGPVPWLWYRGTCERLRKT